MGKTTLELPLEVRVEYEDEEGRGWTAVMEGEFHVPVAFETPEELMEMTRNIISWTQNVAKIDLRPLSTTEGGAKE